MIETMWFLGVDPASLTSAKRLAGFGRGLFQDPSRRHVTNWHMRWNGNMPHHSRPLVARHSGPLRSVSCTFWLILWQHLGIPRTLANSAMEEHPRVAGNLKYHYNLFSILTHIRVSFYSMMIYHFLNDDFSAFLVSGVSIYSSFQ